MTAPSEDRFADLLSTLRPLLDEGDGAVVLLVADEEACGAALLTLTRDDGPDVHHVDLAPVAGERPHAAQGVIREKFDSAAENKAVLFLENVDALITTARATAEDGEDGDALTRVDYLFERAAAYRGLVVLCVRDRTLVPEGHTFTEIVEL